MTARQRQPEPDADPVVEEIRAIRRRLWTKAGGTVKGYVRLMRTPPALPITAPTGQPKSRKKAVRKGNDAPVRARRRKNDAA